jgi:hypothetical protein
MDHVIAMENTEQQRDAVIWQIRKKFEQLDLSILNFSQQVQLAREQKNKDKEIYKNYIAQEEKRVANNWFNQSIDYETTEVNNYKGIRGTYSAPYTTPYSYFYPGSKDEYKSLKEILSKREVIYTQFRANLQRCEDYVYIEPEKATAYLNDVNIRFQKCLNAMAKEDQKIIDQQTTNEQ